MTDLRYAYLLEFRLAGYGWHQRSEFNASYSTYRFFSGLQVLHALCRFEMLINVAGAPYQPSKRLQELQKHALPELGIPDGLRWASPAVPKDISTDRQVYNSRPEPVVGWSRQAVFPTWGSLEMMRPYPKDESDPYVFHALYLAQNGHDIRPGDTYFIGKKRTPIQVITIKQSTTELVDVRGQDTGVYLEIPLEQLAGFDSYRLFDATGRGQVIVSGTFSGSAVVCEGGAVPASLIAAA